MSTQVRVPSSEFRVPSNWLYAGERMAQNYKDLIAWQKAMQLVNPVCEATSTFPKAETYSVTDQIRRAAVSIPSNIGAGKTHYSKRECIDLLRHCRASLTELETKCSSLNDGALGAKLRLLISRNKRKK